MTPHEVAYADSPVQQRAAHRVAVALTIGAAMLAAAFALVLAMIVRPTRARQANNAVV